MTIAIRGVNNSGVGATPRTVNTPTGVIQGDTIYLQVVMALDAAVVTVPSGFTLVTGAEVTGVTNKTQIYSKVAGASEPSSYSVSWTGGGNGQVGLISLLSDFTLVADGVNTANSAIANTSKTWNSVSPAATNAFLMCFGTFVNAASTPDAAMTERWDITSSTMQIYLMTQQLSASGATGTRTATGTSTANQRTITLAVSESGFANQLRITNTGIYVETSTPAVVDITNAGVYVAAQGDDDAPWIAAHVENSRVISLIWVDNGLAGDSYELQTSPDNSTWTTITDTTERTTYTYIHRFLQPLTNYYYRVRRVLGGVNGTWSDAALVTTTHPLTNRTLNGGISASSPISVNKPSGTSIGDLILIQYANSIDADPTAIPSGFTLVTNSQVTGTANQRIYYKVATASEPATYSFTFSSGTAGVEICVVYSDTGLAVEIDDAQSQFNAASTTHTFPAVTADHPGTFFLTWGEVLTNVSSTPPTGMTEINDGGGGPRLSLNSQQLSAVGSTGAKTGTHGSSVAYAATSILAAEVYAGSVPTAPSGLTATTYDDGQINLSWTDNSSDELGFAIYRATIASPVYTLLATVTTDVTTYSDTGLTPVTQYSYKVAAYNGGGLSSYTSVATATTTSLIIVRNVITSSGAHFSPTSYTVNAPSGIQAGDFMLMQVNISGGGSVATPAGWNYVGSIPLANSLAIYIFSKTVTASEPANYTVVFTNGIATIVDIIAWYSYLGLPLIVDDVQYNSNNTANPVWPSITASVFPEQMNMFGVFSSSSSTTPPAGAVEQWEHNTSVPIYLMTEKIRATGATGTRTATRSGAFTYEVVSVGIKETVAATIPGTVTGLTATAYSDVQIDLNWDDISADVYYEIYRSIGSSSTYTLLANSYSNTSSYSDTGLSPATTYNYKVRAVSLAGAGSFSSIASDTTVGIQIRGLTAPTQVVGATRSVNIPAGVVAGDIMIMAIYYGGTITSLPSGFTSIADITGGPGRLTILSKTAGVSEPSSYSITFSGSVVSDVGIIAFYSTNSYPLTIEDVVTQANPASLNHPSGAIVTSRESALCYFKTGTGVVGNTPDPVMTERWDTTAGNQVTYLQTQIIKAFGALGTRTTTAASSGYTSNVVTLAVVEIPVSLPIPPSGLTATPISTSQINLTWADNSSDEDNFSIERSPNGSTGWTVINSPVANATSYSDTGLTVNTIYYYRIQAINTAGGSAYSSTANATTFDNPPTAPSGLTATAISSSRIDLSWSDNSSNETDFSVERSLDGSTGWLGINTTAANATSYSNTGLTANTIYYYRVRAHNSGGYSSYTSVANATTLDNPPTAPSGLTATAVSSSQIDLNWTDNSSNETDFSIERSPNGSSSWTVINTTAADATSYSNTGLTVNTTYYYRVRAHNAIGNSAYTSVANATTLDLVPNAPTVLIANVISSTEIDISWTDNSSNETSFRIDRSLDGVSWTIDYTTVSPNVVSYHNTGLTDNTTYYYRVRAHNALGDSVYTNTASGTTPLAPPSAPSSLTATAISDIYIQLNWTDNSHNEEHFVVERSLTGVGGWSQIANLPPNTVSYVSGGLVGSTTFYYRVKATNTAGSSAYSNIDSDTTLAGRIYYKFSNVAQTTTLPS